MTRLDCYTRELAQAHREQACADLDALPAQVPSNVRVAHAAVHVDTLLGVLPDDDGLRRAALRHFFADAPGGADRTHVLRRACGLRGARSSARSTYASALSCPRNNLARRWRQDAYDALRSAAHLAGRQVLTPLVAAELQAMRLLLTDIAPFHPEAGAHTAAIDRLLVEPDAGDQGEPAWSARLAALDGPVGRTASSATVWQDARREDALVAALRAAGGALSDTLYWRLAGAWPQRASLLALGAAAAGRTALAQHLLDAVMEAPQAHAADRAEARVTRFLVAMRAAGTGDLELAHRLFPSGHVGALAAVAQQWPGDGPLPVYLRDYLGRVLAGSSLNDVVTTAEQMPAPHSLRLPIFLACVEMHLAPAAAAAVPSVVAPATFVCVGCLEAHEARDHFRLVACECPPETAFCRECAAESLRVADTQLVRDACPGGCGGICTRQDLERLDVPAHELDLQLQRIVQFRLARSPDWVPCIGPDCASGRAVPPGVPAVFECRLCGAANALIDGDVEPTVRRRLVQGVSRSNQANGSGVYRECYHCAAPTEKGDLCLHMTCAHCLRHWDFERGPFGEWDHGRYREQGIDGQAFRPLRDGALARLGLYDGLPRGGLTPEQQQVVRERAAAWLADNPPADAL